jgi:Mg-chelatase subunit ChlD
MGEFARFLGLWLPTIGVLVACTSEPTHRGLTEEGRAPAPEAGLEPEVFAPLRYAELPRFVNGGVRCEVHAPGKQQQKSFAPVATPSTRVLAKDDQWTRRRACTSSGILCALLGPSKSETENYLLRRRMKESQERHATETRELGRRVQQAEGQVDAARGLRTTAQAEKRRGEFVYVANDDSMSLSSPQRLFWAIDRGAPFSVSWARPHELLNYFSFETLPVGEGEVFSVLPEISPHPLRSSDLTLGFAVRGRSVTKETRRNLSLTYVLDRSGSMAAGERVDMLKKGVKRSLRELKAGDMVSIVLFDSAACPLAQNFVVERDSMSELVGLVDAITPRGGSHLQDGLSQGYAMADRAYQPGYTSRVLLLTDAESAGHFADEELIALSARSYDQRRIRLSAVGIGESVSDTLLDRITEAGKGASMFASSEAELDAIFGTRFVSLVETVATHVHFKLELPDAVNLRAFYGEEASPKKQNVKSVHFFSGTKQMYLANLVKSRALRPTDYIRLSIEFDDPESGEPQSSEFAWRADELEAATGEKSNYGQRNLSKARMVATFGYQLRYMAEVYGDLLEPNSGKIWTLGSEAIKESRNKRQLEALNHCRRVKGRLDAFFAQLQGEQEARRITDLWQAYCQRYEGQGPGLQLALPHPAVIEEANSEQRVALAGRWNDYLPGFDDF